MDDKKKVIYFGGDSESHALKGDIRDFLKEKGYDIVDLGVFKEDDMAFASIAGEVEEKVAENDDALGVLIFGKKDEMKKQKEEEKK